MYYLRRYTVVSRSDFYVLNWDVYEKVIVSKLSIISWEITNKGLF